MWPVRPMLVTNGLVQLFKIAKLKMCAVEISGYPIYIYIIT